MDEAEDTRRISGDMEQVAMRRASNRANAGMWDLNVVVFLFAVLVLVIILVTYTKMGVEVVGPVGVFGLGMVWLVGWRRGRQLRQRFYEEELQNLEQELRKVEKEPEEETIEDKVRKALHDRWR